MTTWRGSCGLGLRYAPPEPLHSVLPALPRGVSVSLMTHVSLCSVWLPAPSS